MECRYTTKRGLQQLNAEAERRNYNRQIVPEALDRLPENALVALIPVIVHEHAQGKPVAPHLRCFVAAHPDPVGLGSVMLDTPIELFELLLTKAALANMRFQTPDEANSVGM
jgi:hypothetical protein